MSYNYNEYSMQSSITNFMYQVYGWMAFGLALTAGIAYYLSTLPGFVVKLMQNPMLLIGIFIGQLVLVVGLGFFINRMSFFVAWLCFMLYAASVGVTLSSIFLVYTLGSIYTTFLVAGLMFGIMCIYGYMTQSDLTTIGSVSMMALIGLIIAMFINFFLKSPMMDYIISGIGVIVFTLLTAYDSQRIKQMAQQLIADQQTMAKVAIIGALTLYLDFINLFLFLLQFLGKKKD